nr:PREDICTED: glycerol-3-phosphate dehydrogenase 1-like protein isoform X1 [Latimeria chalumnae]|eukprot:XP_014346639.1 PREDICTED: glycerol-3-phosphate dehydrogenase 1-like protein isoform X1 [Latimeria chalumnae]
MAAPLKVCIVGSGNWGSAIARIVGNNVQSMQKFASTVKMWVFEEIVNGKKLTEIVNTEHENVKYLPGYKLPKNVVAIPEIEEAVQDADLLVFVVPHQFIHKLCDQMVGRVSQKALGITLIKNIVAVGAGFCDGLCCGDNTKAAVIRLGLTEMIAFAKIFCKGPVSTATFLESCGVADLVTTCYGGRNRKVAEAFVKTGKSIEELESEMLRGQKLQGPQTSAEVYHVLKQKGIVDKFPLFTAVYQICYEGKPVQEMISCLQSHPEHN